MSECGEEISLLISYWSFGIQKAAKGAYLEGRKGDLRVVNPIREKDYRKQEQKRTSSSKLISYHKKTFVCLKNMEIRPSPARYLLFAYLCVSSMWT